MFQALPEKLHLKKFGLQIERAASRLALSIVTVALIIGSPIDYSP
jgi:hypothetical protein